MLNTEIKCIHVGNVEKYFIFFSPREIFALHIFEEYKSRFYTVYLEDRISFQLFISGGIFFVSTRWNAMTDIYNTTCLKTYY